MGLFSKDKNKYLHGFAKTNDSLGKKLKFVTENKKQNKEDFMEQLMVTLIEADGSKRLPIKVPGDQEPVILPETDVVVGVMGLSAAGRPLEDVCFRPEAAEQLLHIKMSDTKNNPGEQGHILTAADAAAILQSPQGTRKNVGSRPFYLVLNQFDSEQRRKTAEEIFRRLSKDPRTAVIFSAFR